MDKSPGRKKTTIDYDLTDTTTANTVKEMKYMKKNMDNINQRKIQQPIKIKTYTQIPISYQLFLLWKHRRRKKVTE